MMQRSLLKSRYRPEAFNIKREVGPPPRKSTSMLAIVVAIVRAVQRKKVPDAEAAVAEFEQKLERLRSSYEQYFIGISKREPLVQLKDVVRVMRSIDHDQLRNTAIRFRFRSLNQKFNTLRNYWNRTLRQIEAGTYRRDVARVRRKLIRRGVDVSDLKPVKNASDVERLMQAVTAAPKKKPNIRGKSADELR